VSIYPIVPKHPSPDDFEIGRRKIAELKKKKPERKSCLTCGREDCCWKNKMTSFYEDDNDKYHRARDCYWFVPMEGVEYE